VYFNVRKRDAGKSKYTLGKMLSLGVIGTTSFSIVPIRIITLIGLIVFLLSLFMGIDVVIMHLNANTIPGWASTLIPIYFIGGIQVLSMGVIGEYVAKTYMEPKKRPRYIIEKQSERGK